MERTDFKEIESVLKDEKQDLMAERQKELKDAAYVKLRERYTIVIEKPKAAVLPAVAEAGMGTVMR